MRHLKWLGGLALMALLLADSQAATQGAAQAVAHWYGSVAPALLPFLALMPLLTCREAALAYERLLGRAMGALFNLPGAAAPAMVVGMVAGMPAGAIAARNVAARSGMNRGQLHRVVAASSGFSPAFLVGGIGVGLLGSAAPGWKLFEAQLLTQITLAMLLRRAWRERTQPVAELPGGDAERPMFGAALTVCGYMAFFGALTGVIGAHVGEGGANALLCLLDVPSGARQVAGLPLDENAKLTLLAAMNGFGGVCVAMQNLNALKGCGVGIGEYAGLRAVAAAISGAYMALLLKAPDGGIGRAIEAIREKPFEMAALVASLLAIPALLKLKKSVF